MNRNLEAYAWEKQARDEQFKLQVKGCRAPAERGDMEAQYQCAIALGELGGDKNVAEGLAFLRSSAEGGYAPAQHKLGAAYARGEYFPRDYPAAIRWYQRAAEQGHMESQKMLATMYYTGQGTDINYAVAAKWCRLAAEQGDMRCKANLAGLYEAGLGVPVDIGEAMRLYREAGRGKARNSLLAHIYAEGRGTDGPDAMEAARWLCGRDVVTPGEAEFVLGRAYELGMALCGDNDFQRHDAWLRSPGRARSWYAKATEKGNAEGKAGLQRVTGKLLAAGKLSDELPELSKFALQKQGYDKDGFVMLLTPPAKVGASRQTSTATECGKESVLDSVLVGELKTLGERVQADGYRIEKVIVTPDCAAIETANAVFGRNEINALLKNSVDLPTQRETANAELYRLVTGFSGPKNIVVVTSRLNVYRLTSHKLGDGEMLIVASGNLSEFKNEGATPSLRVVGMLSARPRMLTSATQSQAQ